MKVFQAVCVALLLASCAAAHRVDVRKHELSSEEARHFLDVTHAAHQELLESDEELHDLEELLAKLSGAGSDLEEGSEESQEKAKVAVRERDFMNTQYFGEVAVGAAFALELAPRTLHHV